MKSHDVINKEFNAELLETLTAFCKHAKTVYPEIDPKESISLVLCDYMQRWLKDADGHAELRSIDLIGLLANYGINKALEELETIQDLEQA